MQIPHTGTSLQSVAENYYRDVHISRNISRSPSFPARQKCFIVHVDRPITQTRNYAPAFEQFSGLLCARVRPGVAGEKFVMHIELNDKTR